MKPKYLYDKDPWMLAEDIPEIDFEFSQLWLSSFVNDLEKTVGRNYTKILCIYKGYNLKFYYGQKDSDDFAKHVLNKIIKNPKFGRLMNDSIRKYSKRLKDYCKRINLNSLRKLSNFRLAKLYDYLDAIHTELYTWGWLPNAVDMFHANFTNFLKSILAKKLETDEINTALVALMTSPEKSILQQEHESFLRFVDLKQKHASKKRFGIYLSIYLNKYFYLKHLWLGLDGVYDEKYYLREVNNFIKSGESARNLLRKENRILRETLIRRKELIRKLKLRQKQVELFDVYADFAVTKLFRRDAQIYWAYKMDFVFAEIVRRLKIPIMHVRFMFPYEVIESLRVGKISEELRDELKKRAKFCVYYAEKGVDLIFYGKEAKRLENSVQKLSTQDIAELEGQTACLGEAKGRVRIINVIADVKKMQPGDILVSIATNPDIVPAMKKAAAIVTEQGGITSHAAIVSRELGIPCIIGTKIATKVFKNGDLVEVDAERGIVRKLGK